MKVFPTLASTSDAVTVETTPSDKARKLIITDIVGRIVNIQSIPAGEISTRIDTRSLRRGVYNFTLEENEKTTDSGKLIIK